MYTFVLRGTNPTYDHVRVRGRSPGVKGSIGEGILVIFSYRIAIGKSDVGPMVAATLA
jgi:hypothetical protein